MVEVPDWQRAVVTDGRGSVWFEEREVPRPEPADALVRVRAVGICGSDLGLIDGEGPPWTNYPVVLGHEVCAEVIDVGPDVEDIQPGDRVALHGFLFCRTCPACRSGNYHQCGEVREIGFSLDGGYREYAAWPADTLVPIPADIPDATATQIDTAACMLRALRRIDIDVGDVAAVLGAGSLGLYAVQLLRTIGVGAIAVTDTIEGRLATAERLGADRVIDVTLEDPVAALRSFSDDRGIDVIVEAAGAGPAVDTALESAASQGRVVLTGVFDARTEIDPNDLVLKELTVVGGVTAANAVDATVDLFRRGAITTEGIVTHEFALRKYDEALTMARDRRDGLIKAVLRP